MRFEMAAKASISGSQESASMKEKRG